jgi:catechol 2,3-dioxygenase-like lactoylglutathione lyase family enzyme
MNMGIVILYVNDVQKAKKFYNEVIGLPVVEEQSGPEFVTLQPGNGSLLALEDIKVSSVGQFAGQRTAEIGFVVDDADAVWRLWKDRGVEMVTELEDKPFGRTFTAKDPDGYFLTPYQPSRRSN